jgi:hypothetical protein
MTPLSYATDLMRAHIISVPALRLCSGGDGRGPKKEGAQLEITIEYTLRVTFHRSQH